MIKNTAFLALLTVFLIVGWLAGELQFLARYKAQLFREYWPVIVGGIALLFVHLCAVYYVIARWLFVREAGRKLTFVDRQLTASDSVLGEVGEHVDEETSDVA